MSKDQQLLLDQSAKEVHRHQLIQELFNALLYIIFVIIIFYFFNISISFTNVLLISIISFTYAFGKEWFFNRRTKQMMKYQYEYIEKKYQEITLFIPMMDKIGRRFLLKPAAIIVKDNQLYLEAFKQSMTSLLPSESIVVNYSDEWFIENFDKDQAKPLFHYSGKLVDTYYKFTTIANPVIEEVLNAFIKK